MKTKIALLVCAVFLGGCASYSGNYRQQLAYGDSSYYDDGAGYDENPYYGDDAYNGDAYYDDGYYRDGYLDDFYSGGFYGGGYGLFGYGGNTGYCSPYNGFCARDPLAVFLFQIGGGRDWLMLDGYRGWPNYDYGGYGYGYGYGWTGWGFPGDDWDHHGWDHDRDHHHHHHHQDGDPPPVTQIPPGRIFLTPHPRKGIYTPNSMPRPQPTEQTGDADANPRGRRNDDARGGPPMRWRAPGTIAAPLTDGGARTGRFDMVGRPEPVAPPEQAGLRLRDSAPPPRPESTPDRQPSSPRDNADEDAVHNRRHGDRR